MRPRVCVRFCVHEAHEGESAVYGPSTPSSSGGEGVTKKTHTHAHTQYTDVSEVNACVVFHTYPLQPMRTRSHVRVARFCAVPGLNTPAISPVQISLSNSLALCCRVLAQLRHVLDVIVQILTGGRSVGRSVGRGSGRHTDELVRARRTQNAHPQTHTDTCGHTLREHLAHTCDCVGRMDRESCVRVGFRGAASIDARARTQSIVRSCL